MGKPEVLLIDLSSLYWTAAHAVDNYPEAAKIAATAVRRAVGMCEAPLTVVCTDEGKGFRKALAPDYKAGRAEKPAAAYACLEKLKESLRRDGFLVTGCDTFEADDVIASFAVEASKREHPVTIASSDKDLLQLLRLPLCRQIRTFNEWKVWRNAEVAEKFGLEPESLLDFFALKGDKGDNVPGVPSVGDVTARDLILKHFSLDELYLKVNALKVTDTENGPVVETKTDAAKAIGTPAIVDKLWRFEKQAMLSRDLIRLREDAPINFNTIYEERKVMTTTNSENTNLDDEGDTFARESDRPKEPAASAPPPAAAPSASPPGPTESQSPTSDVGDGTAPTEPVSSAAAKPETAMTVHAPLVEVEYEHALEPRSPGAALKLGEVLFESRAFSRFPTAGSITATIMRGRELGISAMASLDAFHYVADMGRILPSWQVIVSLAEESPDCEFIRWIGGDDKSQTWETKHRKHDKPVTLTYRYDQAERAGLVKTDKPKSAWMARPDEMMRKTAACQLARAVYPGATLGLYSSAEMGGDE